MEFKKPVSTGNTRTKKKLGAYTVVLLILLGIFTALVLFTVVLTLVTPAPDVHVDKIVPDDDFFSNPDIREEVPKQQSDVQAQQETKPASEFTPSDMPTLDGVAPALGDYDGSIFYNNPIPDIYNAVSDSVVAVINYRTQKINAKQLLTVYGTGTGFVVSSEGFVLTNAHVIEKAEKIVVRLVNGEEYEATLMGADNETDVAVLRIDAQNLKAIALGDSDNIRVGEFVIAIGNPLDEERLANTTTLGIISATSRELTIDSYTNTYIQTDAAINFGNSGGPLLNMKGEVIGMNSVKSVTAGYDDYGNSLSAEGLGFALPINSVIEIMEHLITVGDIRRPAVGVTVATMSDYLAAELGIPFKEGVLVYSVVKNGPADLAGVLAGDIIVEANGKAITERDELVSLINTLDIGDTIELKIYRDGAYIDCTISLSLKADMDFDDIVE